MRSREDAKGRRRSTLMTPPVPKKVEVLSPAWYRAAVEFQGMPERERLAFCSWCCCHGGFDIFPPAIKDIVSVPMTIEQ